MMKRTLTLLAIVCALSAAADNIAYLATTGDDATGTINNEWRPYKTLQAAIFALGSGTGTVVVAHGTYSLTTANAPAELQNDNYTAGASCVIITNAIDIVGATGNPADVIFKRDSAAGNARVFLLNHADAKLRFVTIQDGYLNEGTPRNGGNILIGYNGGTVEDCIIKNGKAANGNNTNLGGGNISLMAGRCSRSIITGGKIGHYRPIGMNVFATGYSVVENCLITKGSCATTHEAAQDEGAVALNDHAKLVNCSVVKNSANRFSGVNILSGNARAINCVIYGNTVTYETDARGNANDGWANGVSKNNSNLGCYVNCGTDLNTSLYPQLNATCFTVGPGDFVDAANEDWTPHLNAVTRDAGSDYATSGAVSATDLAGNTRVAGSSVDVGCYELQPAFHVNASVDAMTFVVNANDTAHFTAIPGDAVGAVTYAWNFGDGSTLTTNATSVAHKYTVPGSYTVSVTASCDAGNATFTFVDPILVLSFAVDFSRSAEIALAGNEVTFLANTESAVPVSYTWNFGDGTTVVTNAIEIAHAYAAPGQYEVSVTADGGTAGVKSYTFPNAISILLPDMFVKPTGSTPAFPYATWETAAKSLDAVWKYLVDGMTLHVGQGTYQTKDWQLAVTNAVKILGEGATPNDVVFHNGYANFNNGTRNMVVRNPDALVANVTLTGGWANYDKGGNLLLESGVVSNCFLLSGGSNSNGGSGGAAYVSGGVLTHCVITNFYLGNRGNGISVYLKSGRVSNCLITKNRRSWSGSRNAFSLFYAEGGVVDNCTIADCWILKNNPNKTLQMGTASDKGVNIGANARAYNLAISDIRWDIVPASDEDRDELLADIGTPQRWAGTAANFVKCVTDDAAPINATCSVGTTNTMFLDYAKGDLRPNTALRNKGGVIEGVDFPSVDLAGLPRLVGSAIDVGCYEGKGMAFMIMLQ